MINKEGIYFRQSSISFSFLEITLVKKSTIKERFCLQQVLEKLFIKNLSLEILWPIWKTMGSN